ncbi:MAG: hypothetical protein O7C98_16315 [Planctomycetota bacterium]|nr:hypothetical protein [Planctomycetota bacterium]
MTRSTPTLGYMVRLTLNHKWWILVPAVLLFAGAVVSAALKPNVFEAQVVLMAPRAKATGGLIKQNIVAKEQEALRNAQTRLMRYDLLRKVAMDHDLFPELREEGDNELVREVRNNLGVSTSRRSGVLTISFRYSEGEQPAQKAADVVNDLAQRFVSAQIDFAGERAREIKSFLTKNANALEERLDAAERELEAFRSHYAGSLPEDRATNLGQIMAVKERIETLLDRKQRIQEGLSNHHVQAIELELRMGGANRGPAPDYIETLVRDYITRLKSEMFAVRKKYSEDSERVQDLHAQIADAEKQLAEARAQVKEDGGLTGQDLFHVLLDQHRGRKVKLEKEIERAEEQYEEALKEIAAAEGRVETGRSLESKYSALKRTVRDAAERRLTLLRKREEADFQVRYQTEEPHSPLIVEQTAVPSSIPVGPARLEMSLMGLFLGLGLGAALAFMRTKMDRSFHRQEDLRALLPGTVLVTVPDISSTGHRVAKAGVNMLFGLMLFCVFAATIALLGLQLDWWGSESLLESLLRLK